MRIEGILSHIGVGSERVDARKMWCQEPTVCRSRFLVSRVIIVKMGTLCTAVRKQGSTSLFMSDLPLKRPENVPRVNIVHRVAAAIHTELISTAILYHITLISATRPCRAMLKRARFEFLFPN